MRLEKAGEAELETWADRVLDGVTLEAVLKEAIRGSTLRHGLRTESPSGAESMAERPC
ncbi:hypothetical protein [Thiocapsa sp.]|uniref:hypothetical protein n=1 Tax=Thiocapsa sp. TaxID=2024551 RepID=UPI0035936AD9